MYQLEWHDNRGQWHLRWIDQAAATKMIRNCPMEFVVKGKVL